MTFASQGVVARIAKGAVWMVGFRWVERSIGVVSTVVLARLLVPADFGLVAMATAVVALVTLVQAFNFDTALIQDPTAGREDYDTAWTLGIVLAIACSIVLVVIAHPVSGFYRDPRVAPILYCLAAATLVQAFDNVGVVAFRKELTLHREFWFLSFRKLAIVAVTIVAALVMRNYWALVIGTVLGRVIGVALSYALHPYRPRLSLARSGKLLGFSKWLALNNALIVARDRIADIVIARFAGAQALGLFSLSSEISNLPATELCAPVNRAVFPGYSVLSPNRGALRDAFRKVMSMLLIVTVPASLGLAVIAEPLVLALFGEQWREAVPIIGVLALYGIVSTLRSSVGYVFLATNQARLNALWSAIMLMLQVPAMIVGAVYGGIIGAAWGMLAAAVIPLLFLVRSMNALIGVNWRDWRGFGWRPSVSGLLMVAVLSALHLDAFEAGPTAAAWRALLVSVTVGALTYAVAIATFWLLAGRPAGAESVIVARIAALSSKRSSVA